MGVPGQSPPGWTRHKNEARKPCVQCIAVRDQRALASTKYSEHNPNMGGVQLFHAAFYSSSSFCYFWRVLARPFSCQYQGVRVSMDIIVRPKYLSTST